MTPSPSENMPVVTRFAPSPTGYLHVGHAYSALFAFEAAMAAHGRFLLRIDDLDMGRCRPEFVTAIREDLHWLGLVWEEPVRRQSDHLADYAAAVERLQEMGVLYPCFCTRRDIAREIADSQQAPHGPDGHLYPGTCRDLLRYERTSRMAAGEPYALRLDMAKARRRAPDDLAFTDLKRGRIMARPELLGDVVIARKDMAASYNLAVVVDDAAQDVTLVTRGADLFHTTHVQRLLQVLLGLPEPRYEHHALLVDEAGKRFAKRDRAKTLRSLREAGTTSRDLRRLVAQWQTSPEFL